MIIDPAYLAASVANIGLLPLAFENANQGSSMGSHHAHNHTHSGSLEHSFKAGTGEELRGFSVDASRAAKAYSNAIMVLDDWAAENESIIAVMDAEIQVKIDEWQAEQDRKEEERKAKYAENEKRRDAYYAIKYRLLELEQAKKNTWFFSHSEELEKLKKVRDDYLGIDRILSFNDGLYDFHHYYKKFESKIKEYRKHISDKLKVAEFAQGNIYLSRADVLELATYETGEFIENLRFVEQVNQRKANSA